MKAALESLTIPFGYQTAKLYPPTPHDRGELFRQKPRTVLVRIPRNVRKQSKRGVCIPQPVYAAFRGLGPSKRSRGHSYPGAFGGKPQIVGAVSEMLRSFAASAGEYFEEQRVTVANKLKQVARGLADVLLFGIRGKTSRVEVQQ